MNWAQLVFNAFNDYIPVNYALAIIVKRIGKDHYNDMTESALDVVIERLDKLGFTYETLSQALSEVKKN